MEKYNTDREVWKDIRGYEGRYQISNCGRVYSFLTDKILKPRTTNKGYLSVTLRKNMKSKYWEIHRIVALNFLENPNNLPCVNHKDENPKNNRVSNLEWCTHKYNSWYSFYMKNGRLPNPTKKNETGDPNKRKIYCIDVQTGERTEFESIQSTKHYGFGWTCVKDCLSGKQKTHKGRTWHYA